MALKLTESIMKNINTEEVVLEEEVITESIGTETDVDNINQKECDEKVVKLAKSMASTESIGEDEFRNLKDKLTTKTYKMVDKGEQYALQRGEEVLYSWIKKSEAERTDNEVPTALESEEPKCDHEHGECPHDCAHHDGDILVDEDLEETPQPDFNKISAEAKSLCGEEIEDAIASLDEGHTDDMVASVLALAKEKGKNWTEESLRKLTIPQLHVIQSKLINPEYKTRKELAKEKEREEKKQAQLVKTESDGIVSYKVRVGETETILEAESDEEAIKKFDDMYEVDVKELEFKEMGIDGLKVASNDWLKIYLKETLDGKFTYIIRDPETMVTIASGKANSEEEAKEKIQSDIEKIGE